MCLRSPNLYAPDECVNVPGTLWAIHRHIQNVTVVLVQLLGEDASESADDNEVKEFARSRGISYVAADPRSTKDLIKAVELGLHDAVTSPRNEKLWERAAAVVQKHCRAQSKAVQVDAPLVTLMCIRNYCALVVLPVELLMAISVALASIYRQESGIVWRRECTCSAPSNGAPQLRCILA